MRPRREVTVLLLSSILAAIAVAGCHDDTATAPDVVSPQFAKPGSEETEVTGTDPTGAPQDTTLDVEVSGSGFDDGSTVELTLNGLPTDEIRTNSTRYRNSKTLIANITIAADAQIDFYDVEVTTLRGKKGIGTEMFEVFDGSRRSSPTAMVDFVDPGSGESQELYDLRSSAQAMWGSNKADGGKWDLNLDVEPFELTLAFSEEDRNPDTWAYMPVLDEKAECEEISRRLAELQAHPQPLVGSFSFLYDVGGSKSSATVWFDVVVGDYKYNIRNWSCTTCYRDGAPILSVSEGVQDGQQATTFQVRGGSIAMHKTPVDGPRGKGEDDPPSCGEGVLDYVLTVIE
jgi:hypothetical protein